LFSATSAQAIPISFNDFFREADAPVSVAADGSTATLGESPDFGLVYLSNLPGLGDPEVIIGGAGITLAFDYTFTMPSGNADIFHVALLDGLTGSVFGAAYELFVLATGGGHVTFDLSGLGGATLGMQFELAPELADAAFDSLVTLSNLQLLAAEPPPPPPPTGVPSPGTLPLLIAGGLALLRRRSQQGTTFSNEVARNQP
jgi:MYXO-CTERM domain-containing protein